MSINYTDTAAYPYFLARNSTDQIIITSGVNVTFGTLVEGNNFASSAFVAPVKGLYLFTATLQIGGKSTQAAQTDGSGRWGFSVSTASDYFYHVGDNFNYYVTNTDQGATGVAAGGTYYTKHHSAVILLSAGASVMIQTSGIADATLFVGGGSWFSGHLVTAIA